jgi:hypothetical protein
MSEPTAQQHRARINEYLQQFGRERNLDLPTLSAEGTAQVQRGSAVVWIQVLDEQEVLLLLSRVMEAPPEPSAELYRRLLELSYLATGDAAFAVHPRTGEVYLRCLRRLGGLDYEEFEDLVHGIATVADEWDDRLRAEFPA